MSFVRCGSHVLACTPPLSELNRSPAGMQEALARLHQRNLQHGLHKLEEEIRAAKNQEKKAAFLGKIKEPSPHLCAVPAHRGTKQGLKSKSFRCVRINARYPCAVLSQLMLGMLICKIT